MSLRIIAVGLVVATVSGCNCRPPEINTQFGTVQYVVDVAGTQALAETGSYTFPPTPMGTTEPPTQKLIIRNTGLGQLTLDSLVKISGAAVKVGETSEPNPVFHLTFEPGRSMVSSDQVEFDITFAPPAQEGPDRVTEYTAELELAASNSTNPTSKVIINGRAVSGECMLPETLDFGAVNINNKTGRTVGFQNAGIIEVEANAGPIMSVQGDAVFAYKSDSPRGDFVVEAGGERTVTIEFLPTEPRDYLSTVNMRRAKGCPSRTVKLRGSGVNQCLSYRATPTNDPNGATLHFGYVPPRSTLAGQVEYRNACSFPINLTNMRVTDTVYSITMPTTGTLTVPPAMRDTGDALMPGTATATITFAPVALGLKNASLVSNTPLANQATLPVPVQGIGGGPDIDVRPGQTSNFGRIGYFATANPAAYSVRKFTIANVGTFASGDPRANLKLLPNASGKAITWRAMNGATSADELCVGRWDSAMRTCAADQFPATGPGSYVPATGIPAQGAAALLDVPVRITPAGLGLKEWEVTIYSNDPDEAEYKLTIRADAQELPDCRYEAVPTSLNFGVVTPPTSKDLSFRIRNLGTMPAEICYINGLELGTGSDTIFSLPNGTQDQLEIQPNDAATVVVRAWPTGQLGPNVTRATGTVVFNASSATNPVGIVSLEATLAQSCLTVSPNDLNFGTVQKDCNSPDRTFVVYNTCSFAVTVNSTRMVSPSHVPQGGSCTAANGCDEFQVVSVPSTLAGNFPPNHSSSFTLKYRPYDFGPDTGAFAISVTQSGSQLDYLVTLRGNGDMMGVNEDVFRQDSKPKADILFVIDNSGSMSEEQMYLGSNFTAFLRYAVANQVDFQIGITTSDNSSGQGGRLVASPNGTKIFKPTTAGLEQQFSAAVNVGTSGSAEEMCFEPAVKALTAPLITDPGNNLGLLRQDAVLAVVCVSDEYEQSPNPVPQYVNQLLNVKGVQRASLFSLNVIGPFVQGAPCALGVFDTLPGGRYSQAVQSTNGVKENICTPNWATALENLGKIAFGYRTNFYLTARPESEAVVKVFIDGVEQPRVDPRNAPVWNYDPLTNSVVFEPLYVPEPGRSMTVRYSVACIP